MASYSKELLSGSTDGKHILVTATTSPGTTIHTAHATAKDEVYIDAANQGAADVELTIEFGGVTAADRSVYVVPGKAGFRKIIPGYLLTNSNVVKAYAGTGSVIVINGWVNRITG